jgi:hypothetical protein
VSGGKVQVSSATDQVSPQPRTERNEVEIAEPPLFLLSSFNFPLIADLSRSKIQNILRFKSLHAEKPVVKCPVAHGTGWTGRQYQANALENFKVELSDKDQFALDKRYEKHIITIRQYIHTRSRPSDRSMTTE